MAAVNVKGVNKTLVDAGTIVGRGLLGGKVRVLTDEYEATAVESGSTIAMGKDLKVGDTVVGGKIYFDALATGSTLAVGDSTDADRYLAATSSASAGNADLAAIAGVNYAITSTTGGILVTTGGATITGTIKLVLFYVSE